LDGGHHLTGDDVLSRAGSKHQLEEHSLFELLDGVDDGPAFVPPDGLGSEDPTRRKHVDAQWDVADPALPDRLALLVLLLVQTHPSIAAHHLSVGRWLGRSRRRRGGRGPATDLAVAKLG
jgi:hypothetical protein